MGVHGLWRLIEPSGKPVPLETLENKILAVDISIWLHQAIKGFQDSRGAPLPNAHLLGIYHRVCKLLYFRIKPVFVFDGGVPILKRQTIIKRNQQKAKILNDANDIQTKLLKTLLKQTALSKVLPDKSLDQIKCPENVKTKDDIYKLPTTVQLDSTLESSYSSDDDEESSSPTRQWDLHTIDEKSEHFRSLPADVRHDILTEIKETRKQSSWDRLHEMPTESNEFSSFQMNRLLKRFSVQTSLEEAKKEMGGHSLSLGELEALLNEEGIVTNQDGSRIASNANARYLLIKDIQKAMEVAKAQKENKKLEVIPESTKEILDELDNNKELSNDIEYQQNLAAAIQLSLQDQPSTSKENDLKLSFLENFNDGDFNSDESDEEKLLLTSLTQAKRYMMEYSGLTPNEISKIINANNQKPKVSKKDIKLNLVEHEINENDNKENETAQNNKTKSTVETIDTASSLIVSETIANENTQPTSQPSNIKHDDKPNDVSEKQKDNKIENVSAVKATVVDISEESEKIQEISKSESSDSEDSDWVEVNNKSELNILKISTEPSLEIVIDTKNKLEDDIFSDIFGENKNIPETKPSAKQLENNDNTNECDTTVIKNIQLNENKVVEIEKMVEPDKPLLFNKVVEIEKRVEPDKPLLSNKVVEIEKRVEPDKPLISVEELNKLKTNLAEEQKELLIERNTKERMAGNITDQMYQEAQELLELFGVPYIIAPMEAEAQCAFLNEINLTDGTITDDSDIWLFGGKTVYKNFFNHNKHVLEFRSESIEHHFRLSREQLILLALLVGSDYTLGIQGIGPVTALEILAAFPASKQTNISVLTQDELISGLTEFRKWILEGRTVGVGRTALKSKLKNISISDGFPNLQVIQAYLQPKVETCGDRFTWAKPDEIGLIDYAKEKFGWTKLKSEEILKPVLKKLEDRNKQKSIKDYFATKHKIDADLSENKISKRVKTAIKRMAKTAEGSTTEEEIAQRSKRKRRAPRNTQNKSEPKRKNITKKIELESIPQREKDKVNALKSKLKAIEVFRKSKEGPGYTKKRPKINRPLKEEAELSESSSSD